jgi:hypothetical protein
MNAPWIHSVLEWLCATVLITCVFLMRKADDVFMRLDVCARLDHVCLQGKRHALFSCTGMFLPR